MGRQVEHPRKVCQTVIDLHEDTVVTENCEEVITTTCTQVSQEAHHTSAVVDRSHRLVEEGVPVPYAAHPVKAHGHAGYGKREAEAEAEAEPEANAEASADPYYSHGPATDAATTVTAVWPTPRFTPHQSTLLSLCTLPI